MEETRTKLEALTAIEEAAQKAEELLAAAEQRRDDLLQESKAEAERKAAEITDGARLQAREIREQAEVEAKKIVEEGHRESARIASEFEHERSVFEERLTTLSGFLAHALEEVERAPEENGPSATARDLDGALARTPSGTKR